MRATGAASLLAIGLILCWVGMARAQGTEQPATVLRLSQTAERTVSIRRLGKDGQQVMPLDAALAALADEAVPPDVRRARAEPPLRQLA